jgi:hypothetical protein
MLPDMAEGLVTSPGSERAHLEDWWERQLGTRSSRDLKLAWRPLLAGSLAGVISSFYATGQPARLPLERLEVLAALGAAPLAIGLLSPRLRRAAPTLFTLPFSGLLTLFAWGYSEWNLLIPWDALLLGLLAAAYTTLLTGVLLRPAGGPDWTSFRTLINPRQFLAEPGGPEAILLLFGAPLAQNPRGQLMASLELWRAPARCRVVAYHLPSRLIIGSPQRFGRLDLRGVPAQQLLALTDVEALPEVAAPGKPRRGCGIRLLRQGRQDLFVRLDLGNLPEDQANHPTVALAQAALAIAQQALSETGP